MWSEFYLAIAAAAAVLFVPGYLFWRGIHFRPIIALCCAPLYGVFVYVTLPIVYYNLGIACNVPVMLGPALAIGILTYLMGWFLKPNDDARLALEPFEPIRVGPLALPFDVVVPATYVIMASLACGYVFLRNLPTLEAFYSRFDNMTHINLVQAFVDSGKWSTLHASNFLASPPNQSPNGVYAGAFYPCAWHDLNALIYLLADVNVTISANAAIVVLSSLAIPLSTFLFMRALFPQNQQTVAFGALVSSMFATWPWVFLIKGPCYPSLLGMALLPAVLGVVMLHVENHLVLKRLFSFLIFTGISFIALGLSHPNTVFTAYIFMAPYGAHVIDRAIATLHDAHPVRGAILRILAFLVYAAAIVGFWYACYQVPLLNGVLSYHWNEHAGVFRAIVSLVTFRLIVGGTALVISLLVLCAIPQVFTWDKIWMVFPPLFFSICYLASRCGWETLKYWLAAIWYMTPYRFSANISFFCIPIASLGMETLAQFITDLREGVPEFSGTHARKTACKWPIPPAWIVVTALVALAFIPSFTVPGLNKRVQTAFGKVMGSIHRIYAEDVEHVYSTEELAFVEQAKELIPDGALVLNSPNDGSMWAYGVNELNTFYRNKNPGGQTDDATVIREHLDEYATNKDVQEAIKRTEAEYLLVLDKGVAFEDGVWIPQYGANQLQYWKGIDAVNDDTPGFEIVLAKGDEMRLYRIMSVDELAEAA